jgi:hypothetical protein
MEKHTLGLLIDVAPDANRSKGCIWNACALSCMVLSLVRNIACGYRKTEVKGVDLIPKRLAIVEDTLDIPFHRKSKDYFDVDDEV